MKILVVDDSSVMRKLVTRSIRQAGFGDAEIVEAEDGVQAIVVAGAESPDVILSDWNMPNMTGIEMLQALRAAGNNVKVGFVTSETGSYLLSQAAEAGASFFLSKPINSDELTVALGG